MTATIKVSWSISTATSTIRTGRTDESVSQLFVLTSRTGITCLLCSLAWRYLGVYVDCLNGGPEEGEDSGDEEKECGGRKLLWAAYHDPHHRGVSNIEEYSFFDKQTKAYNLQWDDDSENNHGSNDHRDRKRRILGDDNDGDGEEQERFNCFDEAGYTNVNQCYKFETKTAMEKADMQDLQLASDTILRLKVNGRTYGKGGYTSPMPRLEKIVIDCLALAIAFFLAVLVRLLQRRQGKHNKRRLPRRLRSFHEVGCLNRGTRRTLCKHGYLSETETEQSLQAEGGVELAEYVPPTIAAVDCLTGLPVESKITESFSLEQDVSAEV